ncbi:MAG: MarR family winged helix-turn-helix transcriptional regulator [Desulfocucumaceae bacterium]
MLDDKNTTQFIKRLEVAFIKTMKRLKSEMSCLEEGLTPPQFFVLALLQKGQRSVTEIAEVMGVKPSAITAIIDRMQESGFVVREREEKDRRVVMVLITEKGESVFVRSREKRNHIMKHYLSYLDQVEVEALVSIFEKLAGVVEMEHQKK